MPRKSKDELKTSNIIEETPNAKVKIEKTVAKSKKDIASKELKVATKTTKSKTSKVAKTAKSNETDPKSKETKKATKTTDSKTAKAAKATKAIKTTKSARDAKITKSTKNETTKATKVAKTMKTTKTAQSKTSKTTKSTRTSKITKSTKAAKSAKTVQTNTSIISPNVEYYDLPYRYNETVVKILSQTPTTLFIYWDIADSDRQNLVAKYGKDFFEKTKPVLVVHNKTMNYSFEIEINDFANSWYLHVNDANCDYSIDLGRRPYEVQHVIDNYVYITTSNDMEMPNNRILFDKLGKSVFFRNIKNNVVEEKEITSISFIKNLGKVYDIYEMYKEIYKDDINLE